MNRRLSLSGALAAALLLAPFVRSQTGAEAPERVPGTLPGTERWVVHFKARDFDLSEFRAANHERRPASEVAAIVRDLEQRAERHQAPFVRLVEELGGRLQFQYWLVNACAVDVPPAVLDRLRDHPMVARIDPDRFAEPVILRATNALNHNSDALNALGIDGTGVSTAIVDTGLDDNLAGGGRPHRTFYRNGDINNNTSGGIGGSRLFVNRQLGSQPADDVHGHGTGVAGIAAGGDWGFTGSDHGHAPNAGITGYAISNTTGGSSSFAVIAAAWQAVAADAAGFQIVSANNSYSGSSDPNDVSQQALDACALNADVMICVAAGNSGTSSTATRNSQAALNGLAVAAINTDSHTMAGFSSRGPMASGRQYPDIAGCGVSTVMPRRDNEAATYVASGTSMASPQACGAATLIRGVNRGLSAPQTKALLLATAQDISAENPTWNRNSYGLGMVRDDLAFQRAFGTTGTMTLTPGSPTATLTFAVTDNRVYNGVVTWFRDPALSADYSNLDVELLDSSGHVLSSSKTTLNLYENVRMVARYTGNVTLRVTALSFQTSASSQAFSYAFVETLRSPIAASFTPFGSGCPGSNLSVPSLNSATVPVINQSYTAALAGATPSRSAVLLHGFSDQVLGSFSLPLALGPFGGGTCSLLVSNEISIATATNASGQANVTFTWPNDPTLVGLLGFEQFAIVDAGANALNVALSNAAQLLVGGQP